LNRSTKQIGVFLALAAIAVFALWTPISKWLHVQAVSSALQNRTKSLVEQNPQLQPAWTIAMQDEVLTFPEATVIVEAAGEKISPEE
jgi:hypothetical protein